MENCPVNEFNCDCIVDADTDYSEARRRCVGARVMPKVFTRIEPTTIQEFGLKYKRKAVIKLFRTEDGLEHEFTTISREGSTAAATIALTPDHKVITTYQFRPGSEQWVYELPGGGVGPDETPGAGAIRELQEETGYTPAAIEFLGMGHGDAYTNTTWHYFLATGCAPIAGGAKLDQEEADQGVEVRLISITELINFAKNTAMTDPRAVLQAYERLRELEQEQAH